MKIETSAHLPTRNVFGPGEAVPAGVDLAVTVGPWWTVTAVDPVWNHVAAMYVDWSDPAGGPGHWVPVPDGQARLIVTSHSEGRRHPELDDTRHVDAGAAMRTAWDAGLLGVIVFPDLKGRYFSSPVRCACPCDHAGGCLTCGCVCEDPGPCPCCGADDQAPTG